MPVKILKTLVGHLGNRLYEGSFYNSPVLVLAHTAMGDWLRNRQAGVLLNDPGVEFAPFLINLTPEQYRGLQRASADIPTRDLVWTTKDRQEFVCRLAGGGESGNAAFHHRSDPDVE